MPTQPETSGLYPQLDLSLEVLEASSGYEDDSLLHNDQSTGNAEASFAEPPSKKQRSENAEQNGGEQNWINNGSNGHGDPAVNPVIFSEYK